MTLCWYFLFSFLCSTKIDSVDLFWLNVEFTCVTWRTSKNADSPRNQKLPAFMSSLASRLMTDWIWIWMWIWRWALPRHSCRLGWAETWEGFGCRLCATKPPFLHDRPCLTVNRSPVSTRAMARQVFYLLFADCNASVTSPWIVFYLM